MAFALSSFLRQRCICSRNNGRFRHVDLCASLVRRCERHVMGRQELFIATKQDVTVYRCLDALPENFFIRRNSRI